MKPCNDIPGIPGEREHTMKTIAQTIEDACNNSSDALKMAGELGGEEDQDWDNETTTYTFKDKSRLVVSSMNFDAK